MKPNPGSPEAIEQGCKCPRLDNGNGHGCGMVGSDGKPMFWISELCPIHATPTSEATEEDHE